MANAMLDARQEGGGYRRVELIADSFEEGANISEVARRHGVVRGLLTVWRREVSRAVGVQVPAFVPIRIDPAGLPTAAHANPTEMTSSSGQCRGRIESCQEQGPLSRTQQQVLQITRSSISIWHVLAKLLEPPYTRPVRTVVWEGRRREASPYPDRTSVLE